MFRDLQGSTYIVLALSGQNRHHCRYFKARYDSPRGLSADHRGCSMWGKRLNRCGLQKAGLEEAAATTAGPLLAWRHTDVCFHPLLGVPSDDCTAQLPLQLLKTELLTSFQLPGSDKLSPSSGSHLHSTHDRVQATGTT